MKFIIGIFLCVLGLNVFGQGNTYHGTFIGNGAGLTNVIGAIYPSRYTNALAIGLTNDGKIAVECCMTNGQAVLGRSDGIPWGAADVGKVVKVTQAGPGGNNDLTTTILSVNGTNATLNATASTTVYDVFAVYGTDNTVPFTNYVNSLTNTTTIYFPNGIYVLNGALNQWGDQISLPLLNTPIFVDRPTVTLEGAGPPGGFNVSSNFLTYTYGTVLWSTLSAPVGNTGSFIGAENPGQFEPWRLGLKNIGIYCPVNPNITAVNCFNMTGYKFESVRISTGQGAIGCVQPTNWNSFAIITPSIGNDGSQYANDIYISGIYNGLQMGEHNVIDSIWFNSDVICVQAQPGGYGHGNQMWGYCQQECPIFLSGTNRNTLATGGFEIFGSGTTEDYTPYWSSQYPVRTVSDDPDGGLTGEVGYTFLTGSVQIPTNNDPRLPIDYYYNNGRGGFSNNASITHLIPNSQFNGNVAVTGSMQFGNGSASSLTVTNNSPSQILIQPNTGFPAYLQLASSNPAAVYYQIEAQSLPGGASGDGSGRLVVNIGGLSGNTNIGSYDYGQGGTGTGWHFVGNMYVPGGVITAAGIMLTNALSSALLQNPSGNPVELQLAATNPGTIYYEIEAQSQAGGQSGDGSGRLLFNLGGLSGVTNIGSYSYGLTDPVGWNFKTNVTITGNVSAANLLNAGIVWTNLDKNIRTNIGGIASLNTNFQASFTVSAWTNTNGFNVTVDFPSGVTNLTLCNSIPALVFRTATNAGLYSRMIGPGWIFTNSSASVNTSGF